MTERTLLVPVTVRYYQDSDIMKTKKDLQMKFI